MLQLNFDPFPVLTTERLLLREITADDAAELLLLRSDERVMRYVSRPKAISIEDAQKLINVFNELKQQCTAINWVITLKGCDQLIGTICIWQIQAEHYRAELGYMLQYEHWQKGIITEAIHAVLNYSFNTLGMHSIEAHLAPENIASVKTLRKAGFVQEAYFKENYFYNGRFGDTAVYSLLSHKP